MSYLPERRGGPPARRGVPNELRDAILEATRLILEALPAQAELHLSFSAAVDHVFFENGDVGVVPRGPREVRFELRAEAGRAAESPQHVDLIEGATVTGAVVWRDGELDLQLLHVDHEWTRAWRRR